MKIWHLKKGFDRRFRAGHPWVYSNELIDSPKGIKGGESIDLRDAAGGFLAYGYGNPSSLISFRALTRNVDEKDFDQVSGVERKLRASLKIREESGFVNTSHRLCFGEADGFPGLVIDRYRLQDGADFFSIQPHSAGAEVRLSQIEEALVRIFGEKTGIIIRRDISVRKLEGLEVGGATVKRTVHRWNEELLKNAGVLVRSVEGGEPRVIFSDLIEGQKTGLFLDQWANVRELSFALEHLKPSKQPFRVIDLCSYVGQWPVQLIPFLEKRGVHVEWGCIDASDSALKFAEKNIAKLTIRGAFLTRKGDVLRDLKDDPAESYDLVIADPPAFIKNKKDAPQGKHAYLQLFTDSLRLAKKGGWVVACSCSALFTEEEFAETLSKAERRSKSEIRWVSRGALSPDHPFQSGFIEGRYLKCWIGRKL